MKSIRQLKKAALIGFLLLTIAFSKNTTAQSFFGYQTIGKNTFLFSFIWQGKPKIGFSYINRIYGGKTFTDLQFELRFPLQNIYRFTDYDVIAGVYTPTNLKRTFAGIGGHLRWESALTGGKRVQKLRLAATVIPGYVYAASLTDGVYGTLGLRLTYAPVLFATSRERGNKASWNAFPEHRFEGGIHFDMHVERTMGLALNGITTYNLYRKNTFLEKAENWDIQGDFYFGATYWLNRAE